MPKITTSKIIFDSDDWLSGLNEQYGTPLGGSIYNKKLGNSAASMRAMTPFRFLGFLSPSVQPTDITNVAQVDSILLQAVPRDFSGTPFQIGITSGGKLLKFNQSSLFTTSNFPYTMTAHAGHTTLVGKSLINYNANIGGTSALRTFYAWTDNTDWDVGVVSDTTATFDDDFMSTVPATPLAGSDLTDGKSVSHPMSVGEDDILYIGSGRYVHAYDGQTGTNGTFSPKVFTLPSGYVITAFARIIGYLVIFAHNSVNNGIDRADAKAFFWNYLNDDPTYIEELEDNIVTAGFTYNGTVGCFTYGRTSDFSISAKKARLRIYTGGEFKTVALFSGTSPMNGGVVINDEEVIWNSDGQVFSWNNIFAPNKLNIIAEGIGTTTALLTDLTGNLLACTGTTTSGGLQLLTGSTTYYFQSSWTSIMAEPVHLKGRSRIQRIRIKFAKASTGGREINLTIQTDRGATITQILSGIKTIASTELTKDYIFSYDGSVLPTFESIGIVISYGAGSGSTDAPLVSSVEIDYEPIN